MKTEALVAILLGATCLLSQSTSRVQMSIPGAQGALELEVGPTKYETRVRPDGKEVQLRAFERADLLKITAFLQPVDFPASPERCRDEWWPGTKKGVKMQRDDLQETAVKDGIARVEFIVLEFQGVKVRQKDLHAYLGTGELCAEVHLSKVDFKPEDGKLFEDVLSTVKLLPEASAAAAAPQSQDHDSSYYFALGSKFYLSQNYSQAEDAYLKALDLNRQTHTLSRDSFRVLVDNLGMSYGIEGKLLQAKATFVYGLTHDTEYPMFHYNLACTFGEMDKMSEALDQLRLFYKYKGNMNSGETMPDPIKDNSFRHFVNKDEFVKAVHEMQK